MKAGLLKSSPSAEGRKKKELNQGRKGERSDTRGGTPNSTELQKPRQQRGAVDRDLAVFSREKYADGF